MAANQEKNDNKEKIITATKKGAAVLDQWLPDDIKTQYHVLQVVSLDDSHIRVYCGYIIVYSIYFVTLLKFGLICNIF